MAQTPWVDLYNNMLPDVNQEIGDIDIIIHDSKTDIVFQNANIKAKADVFFDLMGCLPDIYANRNGRFLTIDILIRTEIGYTYGQLDTMLDKIYNPDVLKHTLVAKIIYNLWARNVNQITGTFEINAQLAINEREHWSAVYNERFKNSRKQLIIDLNDDGVIVDQDRVRTRTSFARK